MLDTSDTGPEQGPIFFDAQKLGDSPELFRETHAVASFRRSILASAARINSRPQPVLEGVSRKILEKQLAEMSDAIAASDALVITFPTSFTAHTSAYEDLIDKFGVEDEPDKEEDADIETEESLPVVEPPHEIVVPMQSVRSVNMLNGYNGARFEPKIWLKIETGEEAPVTRIENGTLVEDPSQGRWHVFPLADSHITGLNFVQD